MTGSGKTDLALTLARRHGKLEIVNADSLIVYRGMDIGTAKPTIEEMGDIAHHLINIRDPGEEFTAADFVREAEQAITEIHARGNRALIVGGTGFYLKALLFGLWDAPKGDPALREKLGALPSTELHARLAAVDAPAAERIGPRDTYRLIRALEIHALTGRTPSELEAERPRDPDPRFALWILDRDPAELDARIARRTEAMLARGLLEEVRALQARFLGARALGSVGYAQVQDYLAGTPPAGRKPAPGEAGLAEEITLATRQLVKSQRTFFRSLATQAQGKHFVLERDRAPIEATFTELYG